jgi:hypothetical protein
MSQPGSRFIALEGVNGSTAGIVSLRDDAGEVIGMGSRIKFRGSTALLTAAHVYLAMLASGKVYMEHQGVSVPLGDVSVRLYSSEIDRDVIILDVSTVVWSKLGVKALRVQLCDYAKVATLYGFNDEGKYSQTIGTITPSTNVFEFTHVASTKPGWSGTPLIARGGIVIGIHCGYRSAFGVNYGTVAFWERPLRETGDRRDKKAWRERERDFDEEPAQQFDYWDENDLDPVAGLTKKQLRAAERDFYVANSRDEFVSWADELNAFDDYRRLTKGLYDREAHLTVIEPSVEDQTIPQVAASLPSPVRAVGPLTADSEKSKQPNVKFYNGEDDVLEAFLYGEHSGRPILSAAPIECSEFNDDGKRVTRGTTPPGVSSEHNLTNDAALNKFGAGFLKEIHYGGEKYPLTKALQELRLDLIKDHDIMETRLNRLESSIDKAVNLFHKGSQKQKAVAPSSIKQPVTTTVPKEKKKRQRSRKPKVLVQ